MNQLLQVSAEMAEQLSEYWKIKGFRNQIVHGYDKLKDDLTWKTIQTKLPVLREELQRLLDS